jgi:chromosome segregation ATPase
VAFDKQDPVQRMGDEVTGLWRHVGEFARGQSRIEGRLDRIETNVAVLKGDVAVMKGDVAVLKGDVAVMKGDVADLKGDVTDLKGDVTDLKGDVAVMKGDVTEMKGDVGELKTGLAANNERLDRLELSTERRFNRIDAQLERLIGLVASAETKGC